jgi:predicted PurR-regulated permease PerM
MPADKDPAEPAKNESPYTVRVWQTIAIVSLFITILLVVRVAFNVLLMALAGCLIAVYFHGLSDLIQRKTRITRRFAMLLSIGGTLVVIALSVWFIGSKIQIQVAELSNTLPGTIRITKTKLNSTPLGRKVLDYTSGQQPEKMLDTATAFFNTGFGVLGDLYIILFLGLFFTASPTLYKEGILLLVPQPRKAQGIQIIVCQTIVANIATPLLQKKIINLPPALTLMSQLLMGVLSGVLGIILAVPLLAILMILIDELYIKKLTPI